MSRQQGAWLLTCFFLLTAVFAGNPSAVCDSLTSDLLPQTVPNFGAPAEGVFRGGQPSEEGLRVLKANGVKTIINFRDEPEIIQQEKKMAETLRIDFVSIPLKGTDTPSKEEVLQFIELVKDSKKHPLFFHCRRGAERTGIMWACYRVAVNGWNPDRAFEEMKSYKFRVFWFPHLKKFLYDFSKDYGFKKEYTTNPLTKIRNWFLSSFIFQFVSLQPETR